MASTCAVHFVGLGKYIMGKRQEEAKFGAIGIESLYIISDSKDLGRILKSI